MNRIIAIAIVAVVIVAGGVWWYTQQAAEPEIAEVTETESAGETATSAETADGDGAASPQDIPEMVLGDPNAPVTLVEYASYTCPHCASFHENAYKDLKANYIDTGKVKFVFREVYFDRFGLWASLMARCGGNERFFGITDLIFKGQSTWARAGEPVAIADELRKVGRLAGLEDDAIQACFTDEDKAKALIEWYQANVTEDGVDSTPTLFINGEKHGNMNYADLSALLDKALESN